MAYTVKLHLEGVYGLVPDVPLNFANPESPTSVEVFFPNLKFPHDSGEDIKDGDLRRPHFLWVDVARESVALARPFTARYQHFGETERVAYALGQFETISIVAKDPPDELKVNQTAVPEGTMTPKALTPAQRSSLWWVPRPDKLTGKPDHGLYKPAQEGLIANLKIDRGDLAVSSFSRAEDPWNFHKNFQTDPASDVVLQRALPNRVTLSMVVDEFELVGTTRLSVSRQIVKLADPGPNGTAEVRIRNQEVEVVFGFEVSRIAPDADFAEHYRHSLGRGQEPWVLPQTFASVGAETKACAPSLYQRKA